MTISRKFSAAANLRRCRLAQSRHSVMLLTSAGGAEAVRAAAAWSSGGTRRLPPRRSRILKRLLISNAYAHQQESAIGLRSSSIPGKYLKYLVIFELAHSGDNVSSFAIFRHWVSGMETPANCNDSRGIFLLTSCIPMCLAVHM
jgi:hypothetical protein